MQKPSHTTGCPYSFAPAVAGQRCSFRGVYFRGYRPLASSPPCPLRAFAPPGMALIVLGPPKCSGRFPSSAVSFIPNLETLLTPQRTMIDTETAGRKLEGHTAVRSHAIPTISPATWVEPFVTHLQLSTCTQSRSGLGMNPQRKVDASFVGRKIRAGGRVCGDGDGRGCRPTRSTPKFAAARAHAKRLGCPVVVTKLDLLSRDMAFISDWIV